MHLSKHLRVATAALVAVVTLSGTQATASTSSVDNPAGAPVAPLQPLSTASLPVDDFAGDPASRWSLTADVPDAQLDFGTPASSGLRLSWPAGAATGDVAATRDLGNQTWEGYHRLQVTVRRDSLRWHPWVQLRDSESTIRLPLTGDDVTIEPSDQQGWVRVSRSLDNLTPAARDGARPDLATATTVAVGASVSSGRPAGSLEVNGLELVRSRGFAGPTAYMDLTFYTGLDWTNLASRVRDQGFTAIRLIVLHPDDDQAPVLNAFHALHIPVTLAVFPTTDFDAYNAHPEWRQLSLGGTSSFDWRVYLSPSNADYVRYYRDRLTATLSRYPYDGLELTEPWLEVWGGPYRSNPLHEHYMDISDNARQAFAKTYGFDPLPALFDRAGDGSYYLAPGAENTDAYRDWVNFRADTLTAFMGDLIGDAKRVRPQLRTFTTYLADVRIPGGAGRVREFQGQDLNRIVTDVKPDALVIQTAAQDWVQPDLPPDYIADYAHTYLSQIPARTDVLVQTDVGSIVKRDFSWYRQFISAAGRLGFDGHQIYEWKVAGWNTPSTTPVLGDFTDGQLEPWIVAGDGMQVTADFPLDPDLGHQVAHVTWSQQAPNAWAVFQRHGLDTRSWAGRGYTALTMWWRGDGSAKPIKLVAQYADGRQWVQEVPLGQTDWHQLRLDFDSFIPYAGGATGTLDPTQLERIKFVVEGEPLSPPFSFEVFGIEATP